MLDYYKILGVSKDASKDVIDKAYRKLAIKWHPDKNPGKPEAADEFKKIAQAYEILNDPQKRRNYDQFGESGNRMNRGRSPFGSVFTDIFNFGQNQEQPRHLRTSIELTLNELRDGCDKTIEINKTSECDACNGSGASETDVCKECNGSGQVQLATNAPFIMNGTCQSCQGKGNYTVKSCDKCDAGRIKNENPTEYTVHIPPGADEAMQLRVRGGGEVKSNVSNGDLFITIVQTPHEDLVRVKNNLIYEARVTYTQLVLGAKIKIPTLDDPVEITIPPRTEIGQKFKLKELGMPDFNSKKLGDIITIVNLKIPKELSNEEEEALKELAKLEEKWTNNN